MEKKEKKVKELVFNLRKKFNFYTAEKNVHHLDIICKKKIFDILLNNREKNLFLVFFPFRSDKETKLSELF